MSETPPPLNHEPRSVWPPFESRDDRFDHLHLSDPHAWRRAVHLDRMAALMSALEGIELSEREMASVEWLAGFDVPTCAAWVRMLHAACAAAPLDRPTDGGAG